MAMMFFSRSRFFSGRVIIGNVWGIKVRNKHRYRIVTGLLRRLKLVGEVFNRAIATSPTDR